MTRMAGHKISDDGTRIVCTARPDAPCRTRPDCDAETWGDDECIGHNPPHPSTPGHDCWAIPWLNDTDYYLWELHEYDDTDMTIRPGRAVVLTWQDDDTGISWAYPARTKEEA